MKSRTGTSIHAVVGHSNPVFTNRHAHAPDSRFGRLSANQA